MTIRGWMVGVAAAVGVTLCCTALMADDKTKPPTDKGGMPQMTEEQKKMMEACEKLGKPGENHKLLAGMVGEWTTQEKMWMDPSGEPMTQTASCSNKSIWDGRFVVSTYKGEMMGQPWEGQSTIGYDNAKQKFVNTWMDSMSTTIMMSEGTYDAGTKTFTYMGDGPDQENPGKMAKYKQVIKVIDNNKHVFEMFQVKDGKDVRMMEITYTRKSAA